MPPAKRGRTAEKQTATAASRRRFAERNDADELLEKVAALQKAAEKKHYSGSQTNQITGYMEQLRKIRAALTETAHMVKTVYDEHKLAMLCADADISLGDAFQAASEGDAGADATGKMVVFQRGSSNIYAHADILVRLGGVIEATVDGKHGFKASAVIDVSQEPWSNCSLDLLRLLIKSAYVGVDHHMKKALSDLSIRDLGAGIELVKYLVGVKNGPNAAQRSILKEVHSAYVAVITEAVQSEKQLKTADDLDDSDDSDEEYQLQPLDESG